MLYPLSGYGSPMTVTEWAMPTVDNIRGEMARRRRKQTELAAVLGISQSGASNRMSGKVPLTVNELYSIAEWLDVDVTVLLARREDTPTTRRNFGRSAELVAAA